MAGRCGMGMHASNLKMEQRRKKWMVLVFSLDVGRLAHLVASAKLARTRKNCTPLVSTFDPAQVVVVHLCTARTLCKKKTMKISLSITGGKCIDVSVWVLKE